MKVLSLGRPFGTPGELLGHYASTRGHAVRRAGFADEDDYRLHAGMTATELVALARRDWEPELLVCWCPEVAPPPLQIEQAPIPTVAVVSDWTVYGPQLEVNLARYDAVVTDRLGERCYRPYGADPHYVGPLYAHRPGVHRRLGLPRDIDVAFAGNLNHAAHVQRGRLLERVAKLADRYRIVIASDLGAEDYTRLMNRTRIAFNYGLRHEMNLRCFEAVACGALLFMEAENLEVGEWLKDREEVVLYTPETLVPLLEEYLSHPTKAAELAERAYAGRARLAGENRLDDFIDTVAGLGSGGRAFFELDPCTRAMAEVLQYASSDVPAHREYAAQTLADARGAYPDDPALMLAEGCMALEEATKASGPEQAAALRSALDLFRACATEWPGEIVPWMNLAFVGRLAKTSAVERRFLELALRAKEAAHGGLLLGDRRDPYYQQWREGMALCEAWVETLWASASARLGELHLEAGNWATAREFCTHAIALARENLADEIPLPYLVVGKALLAEGDAAGAAAVLRDGLPLTALDSTHRHVLIDALDAAGAREEARSVAEESATLFSAWPAAAEVAAAFRARAKELS